MDYERVVDTVWRELTLEHRADAERALAEFLEILGELLDRRAEAALMSRLPPEMRPVLGHERVEAFELDAFVARLSNHLELDESVAERIVRVSARALAEELDAAALAEVRRCLTPSVAALLRAPEPATAHP